MKFDGKLEIKSKDLKRRHGLQPGGPVQKVIDNTVMRYMGDYMPRRQAGELEHMMVMATVIGSGSIDIPGPYAHYLHEGILYVSPTTGSAWAKKNEIKIPTDKELQYTGAPMRGKKFFDRMKADHKQDILDEAQAYLDHGGGRT
ncbi:minor capsid protein [Lachnospiraceae bacterium ASD3451]|uniref:minor capsid protein n=1 Tax=Diplocloster agilis TaxID=2850323 RepID=UPI001E13D225|nr:minor capsid protein [Diplocloster agilis]MBU9745893.1 minor capsid protein [Diplocloster agilis]